MADKIHVDKIANGYVIDHIPIGRGDYVGQILGLARHGHYATVRGTNSARYGSKDLVMIETAEAIPDAELQKLALLSTGGQRVTVNHVTDRKVSKKDLAIPDTIENMLRCRNGNCISNSPYEEAGTSFTTESRNPVRIRCDYCERSYGWEDFDFSFKNPNDED